MLNAFDGSLTLFGLIVGSYFAGVTNPGLMITVGMSTIVAVSVSGIWGSFMTESAERRRDMIDLEKIMLRKLDKTELDDASKFAIKVTSLVDGLSPFASALVILFPFIISHVVYRGLHIMEAYYISMALCLIVFFVLGAYLGKISRESMIMSGLKMLSAGLVAAALVSLIGMGTSVPAV
ncbi:VIT family protein [Candidatus Gugararchaeum adminiculabundum]|nr:VIT family protein [Candidatus Gugararchaeum adminiculabundum]